MIMVGKLHEKITTNIHNKEITVASSHHDSKLCTEFSVVYRAANSLIVSLVWTSIVASISYYFVYVLENTSWLMVVIGAALVLTFLYNHFVKVYKESLLVIACSGIQFATTYRTGRQRSVFIPIDCIQDVVINEGITMHSVIYYLVVLIKDPKSHNPKSLFPLFLKTCPSVDSLRFIYQDVQRILWIKQQCFPQTVPNKLLLQ